MSFICVRIKIIFISMGSFALSLALKQGHGETLKRPIGHFWPSRGWAWCFVALYYEIRFLFVALKRQCGWSSRFRNSPVNQFDTTLDPVSRGAFKGPMRLSESPLSAIHAILLFLYPNSWLSKHTRVMEIWGKLDKTFTSVAIVFRL